MDHRTGAAASLKALLQRGKIVAAPGAYDALSALLIEQAGFEAIYMTGNGQAASMLGLPDVGLITLTEMADRVRCTRRHVGPADRRRRRRLWQSAQRAPRDPRTGSRRR